MIIPHANLGQIGVVGDQNGQALPVNAWTDSMNVRFTALGVEKIAESTLRLPKNTLFDIFTTKFHDSKVYVFCASRQGLHVYDGEEWFFTPKPVSEDAVWDLTHWGDTVIFNCIEHPPQMFNWDALTDEVEADANNYFVDLPKWGIISTEWDLSTGGDPSFDAEARCLRLIAYKSQLVAVGVWMKEPIDADLDPENIPEESPVYEKTELKEKWNVCWVSDTTSDPTYKVPEGAAGGGADAGITGAVAGGPPSWDYISPATLSVQQVVGAADGRYIAAEQLNESIIIYTATAAHALVFTGGQYVVQTRRLFMRGAAGPQCVVEFGGRHFVIDGDELYIHDGSTATRVGEDLFDVEFFKRAVNLKSATLCHDQENREIWIYFDTNYGRKSAIYNYSSGTFGWGDGEAEDMPITYARRGYLPQTGAQWGDMSKSWLELREPEDYWLFPEEYKDIAFGRPEDLTFFNINRTWTTPDDWEDNAFYRLKIGDDELSDRTIARYSITSPVTVQANVGDEIRIDWRQRALNVDKAFEEALRRGFRGDWAIYTLSVDGNPVAQDKNSVACNYFDFTWQGGSELTLEVYYPCIEFLENQGTEWNWYGYVTPPAKSYVGSTNPVFDAPYWRWIDQQTYTQSFSVLALTALGIHQKEAFFANNRECWVERRAIDLDDQGISGWVIKHLRQYWMQVAGEGTVGIRTGWADTALADPVWEKPTWLDDQGDGSYQADMRTTGRFLSLRFEFKRMKEFRWANGYMDIEVTGRR